MNIEGNPFYDEALKVFNTKVVDGVVYIDQESVKKMMNGIRMYVYANQNSICDHGFELAGLMTNTIDNCVDSLVARHAAELVPDTIPDDIL